MIDPRNFRNRRRDELLVSLAGVVMNLIIAVVFSFVAKIILLTAGAGSRDHQDSLRHDNMENDQITS